MQLETLETSVGTSYARLRLADYALEASLQQLQQQTESDFPRA